MDNHERRLGAKHRMTGDKGAAASFIANRIGTIFRFDFQHGPGPNVSQVDAALNLGLDNVTVHAVAEVRARVKKLRLREVR